MKALAIRLSKQHHPTQAGVGDFELTEIKN
jgi:hypothetical protein